MNKCHAQKAAPVCRPLRCPCPFQALENPGRSERIRTSGPCLPKTVDATPSWRFSAISIGPKCGIFSFYTRERSEKLVQLNRGALSLSNIATILLAAILLATTPIIGCAPAETRAPFSVTASVSGVRAAGDEPDNTVAGIAIAPDLTQTYDRKEWQHWNRIPGSCYTVRDAVLAEQSLEPVTNAEPARNGGRCPVIAGRWHDRYTGQVFTDPAALDIDHVVPLKEAHRSGGAAWARGMKRAYANSTDEPDHLVAVSASENRRKGDRDPAGYMPPVAAAKCWYLQTWLDIKRAWRLAMDDVEAEVVRTGLATCSKGH